MRQILAERLIAAAVALVGASRRSFLWVLLATIVLSAASLTVTVQRLGINTDTSEMISRDLPFRQTWAAFKEAFPQLGNQLVIVIEAASADRADEASDAMRAALLKETERFRNVFAPSSDPFFLQNGLLFLDEDELSDLGDRLADAQPLLAKLNADQSLRGFLDVLGEAMDEIARGGDPPPELAKTLDRVSVTLASVAAGKPVPLSWSSLIDPAADDGPFRRYITVQPAIDFGSLAPASEAIDRIRDIAREGALRQGDSVSVRITGGAAISTEELQSVSAGASLAGLISLFLVGGLLALGLRSLRLVTAILTTLIVGLILTAGFTTLAIGHLNLISVAFAVLFIGLAVDFGIHFGLRYREEIAKGADHASALENAARGIAGPLGLCTVAAAAGFFAFVPTDYAGLSELGLIAGTSMFIALACYLIVLPAMLTLMPLKAPIEPLAVGVGAERWVRRHGNRVVLAAAFVGVAAVAIGSQVRFDSDPIKLRDPDTESVATYLTLLAESRTSPYTSEVLAPSLAEGDKLAERLDALESVDAAVTVSDFIPKDQDAKFEKIDTMAVFLTPLLVGGGTSGSNSDAARRKAVLDMGPKITAAAAALRNGPDDVLAGAVNRLGREVHRLGTDPLRLRVAERALLRYLPSRLQRLKGALDADDVTLDALPDRIRARYIAKDGRARVQIFPAEDLSDPVALRKFVAEVRGVAPDATDSPVEILESGRAVTNAVIQASVTAFVIVTVLLLIVLGSIRGTVLVLAPLLLAAACTVAYTVLFNAPFNFANVIVVPLLMGLGVATGIHLVMRSRLGDADVLAETSTPRAVIFSALTTIGSFGSLAVSSHRGTASMGELLTVAIGFTLIATLIVLPALMAVLNGKEAKA